MKASTVLKVLAGVMGVGGAAATAFAAVSERNEDKELIKQAAEEETRNYLAKKEKEDSLVYEDNDI